MTGTPQEPSSNPVASGGCWGGFKNHLGWCYKKPRLNHLTCWHHRDQEGPAQRLKKKLEVKAVTATPKVIPAGETCGNPHCASCDAGIEHTEVK